MTDLRPPCPAHPHQPLYKSAGGQVQFKANALVVCLLEHHAFSVEQVLDQDFDSETKVQFLQLLGSPLADLKASGLADNFVPPVRLRRQSPTNARHPIQPLNLDAHDVLRFKENTIVRMLLDTGNKDLNDLAVMGHSKEDWEQLAQLIGYSLSGAGDLNYFTDRVYCAAQDELERRHILFKEARLEEQLPTSAPAPGRGPRL